MPFSGGTFSIINSFTSGTTILSAQVNQNYSDIATGLSTCILKDGTQAITATIPFSLASAAAVPVELISTNADSAVGPVLSLYRNSASPADADNGPAIYVYGKDSGGTKTKYGELLWVFEDITDATEDASLRLFLMAGGSYAQKVAFGSTELTYGSGYAVANTSTKASFSANKNGSTQTISSTAETTVTFGTEAFDVGSYFASNGWTPPAGTVSISVRLLIENVGSGITYARIKKNSAVLSRYVLNDTPSGHNVMLTAIDQASGSDVYTVTVENTADTSYTVQGSAENTYFQGTMV